MTATYEYPSIATKERHGDPILFFSSVLLELFQFHGD